MNNLKRTLLILAALAVLASIGSIMDGGRHSGLIGTAQGDKPTTAVTIDGPLPLPVLNVQDPGRIPFQRTINQSGQCSGNACFFEFGTVPTGHRIVIQHISGLVVFDRTPTQVIVWAQTGSGLPLMNFFAPVANTNAAFDQTVQFYADAGQIIEVQVNASPAMFLGSNFSQQVTLVGYNLDCTSAPCAALPN